MLTGGHDHAARLFHGNGKGSHLGHGQGGIDRNHHLIGVGGDIEHAAVDGVALIARRIATRHEHFMPRSLLHSQFEAIEEPGSDENPIIVSIEPQPREIVARILLATNTAEGALPERPTLQPSGTGA